MDSIKLLRFVGSWFCACCLTLDLMVPRVMSDYLLLSFKVKLPVVRSNGSRFVTDIVIDLRSWIRGRVLMVKLMMGLCGSGCLEKRAVSVSPLRLLSVP